MTKKFPIRPANPERLCWGCDRYCAADNMLCGNGSDRTQHPCELWGDDWKAWGQDFEEPGMCAEGTTMLQTKRFTSGRIIRADYDSTSGQLDLQWANQSVLAYKQVPQEVFRTLCNAPNPATYWEDRIAEEYPKATPTRSGPPSDAAAKFADLFGAGEANGD